jgi:hypothetical protein
MNRLSGCPRNRGQDHLIIVTIVHRVERRHHAVAGCIQTGDQSIHGVVLVVIHIRQFLYANIQCILLLLQGLQITVDGILSLIQQATTLSVGFHGIVNRREQSILTGKETFEFSSVSCYTLAQFSRHYQVRSARSAAVHALSSRR